MTIHQSCYCAIFTAIDPNYLMEGRASLPDWTGETLAPSFHRKDHCSTSG
jgi:hypothetical protein